MESVKKRVSSVMKGKYFWLVVALVVVLMSFTIYYIRQLNKKPTYVENKEFTQGKTSGGPDKSVEIYFFYTSWCPHCKTAFPVWNALKNEKPTVKGIQINYIEVDCEKDAQTAEKYSVEGYPTIKLVSGKQVIEYDAKPDLDTLKHFIETSI